MISTEGGVSEDKCHHPIVQEICGFLDMDVGNVSLSRACDYASFARSLLFTMRRIHFLQTFSSSALYSQKLEFLNLASPFIPVVASLPSPPKIYKIMRNFISYKTTASIPATSLSPEYE